MRKIALFVLLAGGMGPLYGDVDDLVISELMAVNDLTLLDQDGDSSDWFEVCNNGPDTVNLDGVFVTDDPMDLTKWRLPAVELESGGYLVVFASDKDRRDPFSELHTNFELTGRGEYLALVAPNGTSVIWEFDPFPELFEGVSYGLREEGGGTVFPVVARSASAKTLIPNSDALGLSWTLADFVDTGPEWIEGPTGVGYDNNFDYLVMGLVKTDVRQMFNFRVGAYIRISFTLPAEANIPDLGTFLLRMKYDDGYLAYVNGALIADRNAPPEPKYNSPATEERDDAEAVEFEEVSRGGAASVLQAGENVLAIHGLNLRIGSSDFLILPELDVVTRGQLDTETLEFFSTPTPGGPNGTGFPGIAPRPVLFPSSTTFTGDLTVEQVESSTGVEYRYTTDGDVPTESSPLFPASLTFSESTLVRVRGFMPGTGFAPSPIVGAGYIAIEPAVASFQSHLPIILVETFGLTLRDGNNEGLDDFRLAFMAIFEPGADGQTRLDMSDIPEIQSRIGIKIRGSSTDRSSQDKKSYRFEFVDEKDEDRSVEPLGLPREADWVLYGSHNWDRSLLRQPLVYSLSNQIGRYASRTRPCEVFVNSDRQSDRHTASITMNDFFGYYTFMENVKRDPNRVDIERLDPGDDAPPEVTGGYIFKLDRTGPGESGFSIPDAGQTGVYSEPEESEISGAQKTWLSSYLGSFVTALNGVNFQDPDFGYAAYIDPESWVDHNILGTLTMNVDALRLSAYFFKPRNDRIQAGPLWDFDRSMDSTDARDDDPEEWWAMDLVEPRSTSEFFNFGWWDRLFEDENFMQLWVDRWFLFREQEFTVANMNTTLDDLSEEIAPVVSRNFNDTPDPAPSGGWVNELQKIKTWLSRRVAWIDAQFVTPPSFSSPGQKIDPGFALTVTAPDGIIWFTRDGTDPRRPGGAVSPTAERIASGASIVLSDNARIVARVIDENATWTAETVPTFWSAPTAATYVVTTPPVVITELMYHPGESPTGVPDADEFEFIEFKNVGNQTFDLAGAQLFGAVDFTFPDGAMSIIEPGEFVVVVANLDAFETRYDTIGMRITGDYARQLGNAADDVGFKGPLGEPIHFFTYSDAWYPSTDGEGRSLNIVNPQGPLNSWEVNTGWAPSTKLDGSPGGPDAPSPPGLQLAGDNNQDGGVDISDAVWLLQRLFGGGSQTLPCDGAAESPGNLAVLNVNGDTGVDLSDPVYLLNYLFAEGPPPTRGTACAPVVGCSDARSL